MLSCYMYFFLFQTSLGMKDLTFYSCQVWIQIFRQNDNPCISPMEQPSKEQLFEKTISWMFEKKV